MAVSCPNCKIPCTGCAGAKLTKASNGVTVCTKCVTSYEAGLRTKSQPNTQIITPPQYRPHS